MRTTNGNTETLPDETRAAGGRQITQVHVCTLFCMKAIKASRPSWRVLCSSGICRLIITNSNRSQTYQRPSQKVFCFSNLIHFRKDITLNVRSREVCTQEAIRAQKSSMLESFLGGAKCTLFFRHTFQHVKNMFNTCSTLH